MTINAHRIDAIAAIQTATAIQSALIIVEFTTAKNFEINN